MSHDFMYYTESEIIKTFNVGILIFFAFVLGFSFNSENAENNKLQSLHVEVPNQLVKNLRIFFIVLLIPYLANSALNFMSGGYADVINRYSSGLLAYSNLIMYALALFMFQFAVREKRNHEILVLYAIFSLTALTGQRIDGISLILTFLLIQIGDKRIKPSRIIVFTVIILFGLYFVNTIGKYRSDYSVMITRLLSLKNFTSYISNNPFTALLQEFGGTVASLLGAVKYYVPGTYLNGLTYLAAVTYIVPKLNVFFPEKYLTFIVFFPNRYAHGLGGSVIGELYANFGIFSIFAGFVMSIVFSKAITKSAKEENGNSISYNFYYDWWKNVIIFTFILVIRGYVKNIVFLAFWGYLFCKYLSKKYSVRFRGGWK